MSPSFNECCTANTSFTIWASDQRNPCSGSTDGRISSLALLVLNAAARRRTWDGVVVAVIEFTSLRWHKRARSSNLYPASAARVHLSAKVCGPQDSPPKLILLVFEMQKKLESTSELESFAMPSSYRSPQYQVKFIGGEASLCIVEFPGPYTLWSREYVRSKMRQSFFFPSYKTFSLVFFSFGYAIHTITWTHQLKNHVSL